MCIRDRYCSLSFVEPTKIMVKWEYLFCNNFKSWLNFSRGQIFGIQFPPGEIIIWDPPEGDSIRIDTHCYKGYYVPPYYDSLIAKVITKGSDRYEAITNMQTALGKFSIGGINTNLPFHQFILQHPDFLQNSVNTSWVETILSKGVPVWVK